MKDDSNTKKGAISRANAQMLIAVSLAALVSVFCLIAARAVWSLNSYQARIIDSKTEARNQLKENIKNYSQLAKSYKAFNSSATNYLGGTPGGGGDKDGTNAKIVLDALPPGYDFPALTSSIEKLVTDNGLKLSSITGSDDQINQQGNISSASPQKVAIPFSVTITGANYGGVKQFMSALQLSIRPIVIESVEVNGGSNNMSVTINAHTYFQPAKNVSITKKVIK